MLMAAIIFLSAIQLVKPVYENIDGEIISCQELREALYIEFGNDIEILQLDKVYRLVNPSMLNDFIQVDDTASILEPGFDCDDYSIRFWGNTKQVDTNNLAIGVAVFDYDNKDVAHMTVLFVDYNKEVWLVNHASEIIKPKGNWTLRYVMI